MALIDTEGFGFSTTAGDYATYGAFATVTFSIGTGGPLGDNYAAIGNAYNGAHNFSCRMRALPASYPTLFFGARLQVNSGISSAISFNDVSTGINVAVQFNAANGLLSVTRGLSQMDGGVALGSSNAGVFSTSGFFYFEAQIVISSTVGAVTLRINGTPVLTLTGINTAGVTNSAGTNSVSFETATSLSGGINMSVAHVYFCDSTGPTPWNSFLGDCRVATAVPTSNDVVAFTPNGLATNWQNAAKIPPVPATDFNSAITSGTQDTFNCGGGVPVGLQTIYGINVKTLMSKNDAGTRTGAAVIKSSGTVSVGQTLGLGTSTQQVKQVFATDPATGAQWTWAAANAAQPGYKVST